MQGRRPVSIPIADKEYILDLLRCPLCRNGKLNYKDEELVCRGCGSVYHISGGRPILLRPDNTIFPVKDYVDASPYKEQTANGFSRFIPGPSVNLAGERVLKKMRSFLDENGPCDILVVGGGRQRTWLDPLFSVVYPHRIVYSDIDSSADVDIFCDAHDLPFVDSSFDAVITTAVLEHVLYPERVSSEIFRVLKNNGLLYSEIPFMQQVHEGAYDFTRYTLSGHRRLFNGFDEVESGMVAGPGTSLVWAIENYILSFFSTSSIRKYIKALVRIIFSAIKYSDIYLADKPQAMDGASCTYLLGRKTNRGISDQEIINKYIGAKHMRHT
jgi:uncharacterized protein YbaR (Trm112 family)